MRHISALLAVVVLLSFGRYAAADVTLPILPDLKSAGWEMLSFNGIPETSFRTTPDGAIEISADKSSSVLYLKVADDPVTVRRLSWEWQVIKGVAATDLTKTDGDDRTLSIYVAFSDGSMTSKIKAMISPLTAGNALNYVWGGDAMLDIVHPHLPDCGQLIVKRTASTPTGEWFTETVDLAADYERAFGKPMPGLAYIAISGDADDLATTSKGLIRNIVIE